MYQFLIHSISDHTVLVVTLLSSLFKIWRNESHKFYSLKSIMFGFVIKIEFTIIFSLPTVCGGHIVTNIIMFKILILLMMEIKRYYY